MSSQSTPNKPSVVFMGTPDFAVPALVALHQEFGVRAVVTVPDKPRGRGLELQPSAVKLAATQLGITSILQPEKLRDPEFVEQMRKLSPDIICVIAFRILPREVYTLARLGSFNVHASLLPKYRGAAPINHAIIRGEKTSGVTSFVLNDVVDAGTVVQQKAIELADGITAGELYTLLQPLAAACAVETTRVLLDGNLHITAQDEALATPAPKVFRETSIINWKQSAHNVRNFIHGLSPTPCAWTIWNNQTLKVFRATYSDISVPVGEWIVKGLELIAGCNTGALSLTEVQLPGKKRMATADILRGYRGNDRGKFTGEVL